MPEQPRVPAGGANADRQATRQRLEARIATLEKADGDKAKPIDLATAEDDLGQFLAEQGDDTSALLHFDRSIAVIEKLLDRDPEDLEAAKVLVDSAYDKGETSRQDENYGAALRAYRRAEEVAQMVVANHADRMDLGQELATIEDRLGQTLEAKGQFDDALAAYKAGLDVITAYGTRHPDLADARKTRGLFNDVIGRLMFRHFDPRMAKPYLDTALTIAPFSTDTLFERALIEAETDDPKAAARDFADLVKARPKNFLAYSVLLLHLARRHAGEADEAEFAANVATLNQTIWPWPILALFRGEITPVVLREQAEIAKDADTRQRHVCEADFYTGLFHREAGRDAEAAPFFQSAAERCPLAFVEYAMARYRLQQSQITPEK